MLSTAANKPRQALLMNLTAPQRGVLASFALLLVSAIAFTVGCGQASGNSDESMTGVWFTQAPASWIVETQAGPFSGSTQMRWELAEHSDGTISGFNIWCSPGES